MCTKPAALELQTVQEMYSADEDLYIIGACKNITSLDTLDEFRQFHNLTFPLSSSEELGSYYNLFNETFNTLGNNSVIIKKMPFYTEQSVIEESIEQSIVSYEGLYLIDDIKNYLLIESSEELNLEEIFYTENGIDVDFALVSSSNQNAVDISVDNTNRTISLIKNLDYGRTNVIISASLNSTGDEIYSRFTVHNSTAVFESFESGDLTKFSWIQEGSSPWEVTESKKFTGNYSLMSTGLNDGDNSELNLNINISEDDSISFAYLSTDNTGADYFEFKIDGVTNIGWYGYHPWEKLTFPLSAGTHHLSWNYTKTDFESDPNTNLYLDGIIFPESTVGIGSENYELRITNYELKQNYPNPFNPITRINYELRITNYETAEIVVYNTAGQKVWSSPITRYGSPVTDFVLFDGSALNSGVYYYSLVVDGKNIDTKSMILVK